MAKKIKIKRYTRGTNPHAVRKSILKKTLSFILVAAVLFGIGYFAAKPVFNFLSTRWYEHKQSLIDNSDSSSQSSDTSDDPQSNTPVGEQPSAVITTNIYSNVNPSILRDTASAKAEAAKLKAKGVTHAVITVKTPQGKLLYTSNTEIGKLAKGDYTLNLSELNGIFKAEGITLVANIYTFMDKTTPDIDRSTSVKYIGTDFYWLDTSKELGGKPWTNPASPVMQKYIFDITEEVLSSGISEIIFSAVQLPTGYSLDKRDFGATQDQLLAQMKGFITTLQGKVTAAGGKAVFAYDFTSVNGGDYSKYIANPLSLGADNLVLTATLKELEGVDALKKIQEIEATNDINTAVLWITDGEITADKTGVSGYFVP